MAVAQRHDVEQRWNLTQAIRALLGLTFFLATLNGFRSSTVQAQGPDLFQELMRSLQNSGSSANSTPEPLSTDRVNGLGRVYAPLAPPAATQPLDVTGNGQTFTVRAPASTIGEVVSALSRTASIDIVLAGDGSIPISLSMHDRSLEEILSAVCMLSGYSWRWHGGTILVAPLDDTVPIDPRARGTVIRSVELHYTTADTVQVALQDMLTPVGSVHMLSSDVADHRKAREVIIIEDVESNVDRLLRFIHEIDVAPRQVMIEAYVLQVDLKDEDRHGVNFDKVVSWAGVPISFEVNGFANPNATQAFLARVDGQSLDAVLEALRTQTDSRTLASPRLLVVNGQEKRLQVGEQLGYRTVTTSQSGVTQENIQFLDVGVILSVTPRISPDDRILLKINSEVSTGLVNPQTGLPEESTSEVDTDVLLENGHGIIIGGLIQEEDTVNVSGIKWLSDLKWIGPLFQRKEKTKKRSEIIFVVMPRILHDPREPVPGYDCQYDRATHSLFPETPLPSVSPCLPQGDFDPYMQQPIYEVPYDQGMHEQWMPYEIPGEIHYGSEYENGSWPELVPVNELPVIEPGPVSQSEHRNAPPRPFHEQIDSIQLPYETQASMTMSVDPYGRRPSNRSSDTGLWKDPAEPIRESMAQRLQPTPSAPLSNNETNRFAQPEIARLPSLYR